MSYESSNPGAGFGAHAGNPNGGVGGSNATGRSGAAGGGGGYTYRSYRSKPTTSGNWNTGGHVTGYGSQASGISGVAAPTGWHGTRQPSSPAPAVPVPIPTSYPLPGEVTDVFGPRVPMDPGIVGHMLGTMGLGPRSPFGSMPGYGGSKDQSRHPGMAGLGFGGR